MEVYEITLALFFLMIACGIYIIVSMINQLLKVIIPIFFLGAVLTPLKMEEIKNLDEGSPQKEELKITTAELIKKFPEEALNDYLQLDAFENLGNAKLCLEIQRDTFPEAFIHFEEGLHRVWLGPYHSWEIERIKRQFPGKRFWTKKARLILKES